MVKQSFRDRVLIHLIANYASAAMIVVFAFLKIARFAAISLVSVVNPFKDSPYGENEHEENVTRVQKQVKDWNASGRKSRMCTARPGWQTLSYRTPIYKNGLTGIHINMNKLIYIKIDENMNRNVVCVEPMMTIGELTLILEQHGGWTLPVVPELNDLTIGGLVCGAGLETSSHKYGMFHNICVSFEFIISSGEVLKVTEESHPDIYYAIPGSHGTLGFLTAVELQLIPAKTHVKLEYIPVQSLDEAISTFEEQTYRKNGNEFVEGIMYSLDKGVIMVGDMVSDPPCGMVNQLEKWYKPWFYKHVETFLNKKSTENRKYVEYIPLRDYYHRHTRGLFWETANFVTYGNHFLFRYLLGWVLPLRIDLLKLIVPKSIMGLFDPNHVTQDFVVPMDKLKAGLIMSQKVTNVYPIWLCPTKFIKAPGVVHFLGDEDEMFVDIGIYGMSNLEEYEIVKSARALELFCVENRGYQALYSDVCLTKEEFGKMFKHELYLKMRQELNCDDAFPDVYEKVCRAARC